MRWTSCLSMLLFLSSTLHAQQDSSTIQQKILQSEEPEQVLIQRTRNFILTKLEAGNTDEAYQAYRYALQKLESESVKPFWLTEQFLLGYWFGNYDLLYSADSIESALNSAWTESSRPAAQHLYPQPDRLAVELRMLSKRHRLELLGRVAIRVNDKEENDYLTLFFDWLTFDAVDPQMTAREEQAYLEHDLTPRAEEFLATYKDSRFRPFVRRRFRYVYVLSDWGFGYYLGMGSLAPTGVTERYFKPELTFGLGGDASWKGVLIHLGYDIGLPVSVRRSFIYEGKNWNTDIRHNYNAFYATFGWVVTESNTFKLSPHIGPGLIDISAAEADKDKPGGDVSMTQGTIQVGLTCDIKLTEDLFFRENSYSYGGARLSLDYCWFLGNNPILSSGMIRFNISWVGFSRSIFRDM